MMLLWIPLYLTAQYGWQRESTKLSIEDGEGYRHQSGASAALCSCANSTISPKLKASFFTFTHSAQRAQSDEVRLILVTADVHYRCLHLTPLPAWQSGVQSQLDVSNTMVTDISTHSHVNPPDTWTQTGSCRTDRGAQCEQRNESEWLQHEMDSVDRNLQIISWKDS